MSWRASADRGQESGNRLLIDDALAKSGKRTVSAYEVSHVMTLLGLVEAGLGVAAVPRLAMPLKDIPRWPACCWNSPGSPAALA